MKQSVSGQQVAFGGPEGGRRPTEGPPEEAPLAGPLQPGQRWSVARKREAVLRLLRGESLEALSRQFAVEVYRLERWREQALSGMDLALKERSGDPLQGELDQAM